MTTDGQRVRMYVYGSPAPQGSKRHVGRGVLVESSKAVGPWREAIVAQSIRSGCAGWGMAGPLRVRLTFHLRRPAGHYGKRGLRPGAPEYPNVRPDLDKLVRSTLDGLAQAAVIADDALVVMIEATKRYADSLCAPGAAIFVDRIA